MPSVIDIGAKKASYPSDITRMVAVGRPPERLRGSPCPSWRRPSRQHLPPHAPA